MKYKIGIKIDISGQLNPPSLSGVTMIRLIEQEIE